MKCPHNFHCVGGSDKRVGHILPLNTEPRKSKGKCYKHHTINAIAICGGKPVCLRCWERMGRESPKLATKPKDGKEERE